MRGIWTGAAQKLEGDAGGAIIECIPADCMSGETQPRGPPFQRPEAFRDRYAIL